MVHDLLAAVAGQVQGVEARGSLRQPEKKRKERFTLFSDHTGSLLRWQPKAQSNLLSWSLQHVTLGFETRHTRSQGRFPALSDGVKLQSYVCIASGSHYHFLNMNRHQNKSHVDMLLCPLAQAVSRQDKQQPMKGDAVRLVHAVMPSELVQQQRQQGVAQTMLYLESSCSGSRHSSNRCLPPLKPASLANPPVP